MFYRFIRAFFLPFILLLFPTKIINKSNYTTTKAVVCCNHFASADVLIIASHLFKKECNVLGKAELFRTRFSNWFLRKLGAIPVKRGEPDIAAHKEILRRLKNGKQIVIFPEGTRNRSGSADMADFKSGAGLYAAKAKVPIIPILLHHSPRVFKKNYLIVGEPIDLSQFYNKNLHDIIDEMTLFIHEKMELLQKELDGAVASVEN